MNSETHQLSALSFLVKEWINKEDQKTFFERTIQRLKNETPSVNSAIEEYKQYISEGESGAEDLFSNEQLKELKEKVERLDKNKVWRNAHLTAKYANVYNIQMENICKVEKMHDVYDKARDMREACNKLSDYLKRRREQESQTGSVCETREKSDKHKYREAEKYQKQIEELIASKKDTVNKILTKLESNDEKITEKEYPDRVKKAIVKRKNELEKIKKKLVDVCFSTNGSTIGALRVFSDISGIESTSIVIASSLAAGAAYHISKYWALNIGVIKYWVVEDFFNASIIGFFVIIPVAVCAAWELRASHSKVMKKLENKQPVFRLFGTSKLADQQPSSYLGKVFFLCMLNMSLVGLIYGNYLNGVYTINSKVEYDETLLTNQNHLIDKVRLIGTSSHTAFVQQKWKGEVRQIFLDRAQILCHSAGSICKDVQGMRERDLKPQEKYDISVTIKGKDTGQNVSKGNAFSLSNFGCDPVQEKPVISLFFKKNNDQNYCDRPMREGDTCARQKEELDERLTNTIRQVQRDFNYLLVVGHASNEGEVVRNFHLGEQRAKTIFNFLTQKKYSAHFETLGQLSNTVFFDGELFKGGEVNQRADIFACRYHVS